MSADRSNNPWLFDLRLRERNLRSGALDEKELTKHLGGLKDLESETDTFGWAQPAIGDGADEDDDDLDDELESAGDDTDDDDTNDEDDAKTDVAAATPEAE